MKHLPQAYNSFLWAAAVSAALFNWTWLEMRVNIGLILFALFAVLTAAFFLTGIGGGTRFTLASIFICTAVVTVFAGTARVLTLPAFIVREGLGMTRTPLSYFTAAIAFIVIAGGAVIVYQQSKRRI